MAAPTRNAADSKLKSLVSKYSFRDEDIVEMQSLAARVGGQGNYDADTWMPFYSLQSVVPITTYNENLYLKQNRSIVLADDSVRWYVRILDYKVTDEVSPFELQRENIRAIILNHRKLEILDHLSADLVSEAKHGGHVHLKKNNTKRP